MAEAKSDLEKTGLFRETGFISIGDPYVAPGSGALPPQHKGKQLVVPTTKSRTATMDGYFDPKYPRILEGEASYDPVKQARKDRKEAATKNVGSAFFPPSAPKSSGGPGNTFGTFTGKIEHFSAASEPPAKPEAPKRNFYTNPGKKGTGYGYLGVTFGTYAKHPEEPYEAAREQARKEYEEHKTKMRSGAFKVHTAGAPVFDGNPYKSDGAAKERGEPEKPEEKKKLMPFYRARPGLSMTHGGKYTGTFDKYPTHSDEPPPEKKSPVHEKVFRPPFRAKSRPVQSVISRNVTRHVNAVTYRSVNVS